MRLPDGPVLALDSSTRGGSVAIAVDGRLVAERALPEEQGASSTLLPAADALLREARLAPADLRAVVAGGGPGSFTGLRIAAATAKGMVRALEVPLFVYSGLQGAAAARRAERPVCALFDARNREVYAGCWSFGSGVAEERMPIQALGVDALMDPMRGIRPIFTGEGAWMHAAELTAAFGADAVASAEGPTLAAGLLWLAATQPEMGYVVEAGEWEPDYVRAPGAERIAAEGKTR
jgi:tRNA threonylcarbamoyladenosine biosynthesis protein TsaB